MRVLVICLFALQVVASIDDGFLEMIYDPFVDRIRGTTYEADETKLVAKRFGNPTRVVERTEEARNPKTKSLQETWFYEGLVFEFIGVGVILDDGSIKDRGRRRLSEISFTNSSITLRNELGIGAGLTTFQNAFPNLVAMNRQKTVWQAGGSFAPKYDDGRSGFQIHVSINIEFDASQNAQRITWRYEDDH